MPKPKRKHIYPIVNVRARLGTYLVVKEAWISGFFTTKSKKIRLIQGERLALTQYTVGKLRDHCDAHTIRIGWASYDPAQAVQHEDFPVEELLITDSRRRRGPVPRKNT